MLEKPAGKCSNLEKHGCDCKLVHIGIPYMLEMRANEGKHAECSYTLQAVPNYQLAFANMRLLLCMPACKPACI